MLAAGGDARRSRIDTGFEQALELADAPGNFRGHRTETDFEAVVHFLETRSHRAAELHSAGLDGLRQGGCLACQRRVEARDAAVDPGLEIRQALIELPVNGLAMAGHAGVERIDIGFQIVA